MTQVAKEAMLLTIWHRLQNTKWQLRRTLHSIDTTEPSGTCTGTATFTTRPPSTLKDREGERQVASQEMLYSEQGELTMSAAKFPFSRKYVWRLRDMDTECDEKAEISIWFTQPGTEKVDYLFHAFTLQRSGEKTSGVSSGSRFEVECSGGHLCVEDYYSSSYIFDLQKQADEGSELVLKAWKMRHDVKGPKKDQSLETYFTPQETKS